MCRGLTKLHKDFWKYKALYIRSFSYINVYLIRKHPARKTHELDFTKCKGKNKCEKNLCHMQFSLI